MNELEQMIFDNIQRRANINPIAQNVLNMYQQHDSQGLWTFIDNVCREKGYSKEQLIQKVLSGIR